MRSTSASLNLISVSALCLCAPLNSSWSRPNTLHHEDDNHTVSLLQDPQRSSALLHDHERTSTELYSLAGGCRVRLSWESDDRMRLSTLKAISTPSAIQDALSSVKQEEAKGGAARLIIKAKDALTLKAAHSAGCALPDLRWAHRGQTRPAAQQAQRAPTRPLWRTLTPTQLRDGSVLLSDEGFYVLLNKGRGRLTEITARGSTLTWRSAEVTLKLTTFSAHEPLTPLPPKDLKLVSEASSASAALPICAMSSKRAPPHALPCERLKTLLAFLSYQEGIYEGLGSGVGERGTSALLGAALLAPHLPTNWSKVALGGALERGIKWPLHYREPLAPLDGRFAALPLLAQLLNRLGEDQAEAFLKSKRGWRMWGSMFTAHLRGLMRLASHFANRPSRRYLLRSQVSQDQAPYHDLTSNITLMPWSLSAAVSLLRSTRNAPLLGARPGEAKRLSLLLTAWRKASHLFERRVEVHDARRRAERWSRQLLDGPQGEPWLDIIYDVDVLSQELTLTPEPGAKAPPAEPSPRLSAISYLAGLLGTPTEDELSHLLFLGRPYPIGLMSPVGLAQHNELLLSSAAPHVAPPDSDHPVWIDALYQRALTQQRQRFWPYKIASELERQQLAHWAQLTARPTSRPLTLRRRHTATLPKGKEGPPPSDQREPSRHGWHLLSCLALTLSEPPPPEPPRALNPSELGP